MADSMDELLDIIDESGNVLRQATKKEAHEHGWLHATVIGCLRYGQDWALVRQTPDRQDGGQLVNPVGGHVRAGETWADALFRESEEEIGTRNLSYKFLGKAIFRRQVLDRDENHLFAVYEITTPDPIILGSEAESIQTFTEQELQILGRTTPDAFGAAYFFVVEHFFPELVPSEYQYRWRI